MMAASLALSIGCTTAPKFDLNTAQGLFDQAEYYAKDERFEEAIEKFEAVKNKHPYSKYAVEAKLRIADIQYERDAFIEAQGAYQLFKDMHPKHPKIDYVTFRLAMSYYNQLPSTIDRDLSVSDKAIQYFNEVLTSYPNSEYVPEAKEKKADTLKKLAAKEYYIGDFYFIREKYESALNRFEGLLKTYPDSDLVVKTLYGAAYSAHALGRNDKAQRYYSNLKVHFPDSEEYRRAKEDLNEYD